MKTARGIDRVIRQRGFTLVELLVVVSIIALLIAILLPSLKNAREQARTVKCLTNVRTMGQGIGYYADDSNQVLPGPLHPPIYRNTVIEDPDSPWDSMNLTTEVPWFLLSRLAPFFSKNDRTLSFIDEVATCPTATKVSPDRNFLPNAAINGYHNPSWSRPYHYLPNSWSNTAPHFYFGWINIGSTWTGYVNGLSPNEKPYELNTDGKTYYRPKNLAMIKRPADEWAIGDAWWNVDTVFIRPGESETSMLGPWQLLKSNTNPRDSNNSSHNPLPQEPIHRGRKGTNLVYFDGHAATFSTSDIKDWALQFPANRRDE